MTRLFQSVRCVLPILLFGYGIAANLAVMSGPPTPLRWPTQDLLAGGLTREFEEIYKSTLPHFTPAFGWIGAARYLGLNEVRRGAVAGQAGWLFTAEEARALPDEAAVQAAVDRIAAVRAKLARLGTDLVLVPLPAKIDIAAAFAPDQAMATDMAALHARFVARSRQSGITTIDPRPTLLAQGAQAFLATDTHWTPLGARVTARTVAKDLPQGPLIYATGPPSRKILTGDLIRYVTTDDLAPQIGLMSETVIIAPLTATGPAVDIFATAPADIVLIGTSYSANADWGFADALMQSLGRDVINLASSGQGPLVPMQSYLDSPEARDTPAKLVIWEVPVRYLTDPAIWRAPDPIPTLATELHGERQGENG
jgi:alginate O-acetyltransferase complex protein AlgJ